MLPVKAYEAFIRFFVRLGRKRKEDRNCYHHFHAYYIVRTKIK